MPILDGYSYRCYMKEMQYRIPKYVHGIVCHFSVLSYSFQDLLKSLDVNWYLWLSHISRDISGICGFTSIYSAELTEFMSLFTSLPTLPLDISLFVSGVVSEGGSYIN